MIDEHESILFIEAMCGSKLVRRPEINVPGLHLASADQRLTKKSCRDLMDGPRQLLATNIFLSAALLFSMSLRPVVPTTLLTASATHVCPLHPANGPCKSQDVLFLA